MSVLAAAMRDMLAQTGIDGLQVEALALDRTGSSVVVVEDRMQPLDDYYLWCDHRTLHEARQITKLAHAKKLEAIDWCGGVYSHEWGWAKLLHWLRHNPAKREHFASAFEHCDIERVVNAGGIPQNNAVLNQVYADVLNKPVLVPDSTPTSIGSGIFAQLAGISTPSKRRRTTCARGTRSLTLGLRAATSMRSFTRFTGRSSSRLEILPQHRRTYPACCANFAMWRQPRARPLRWNFQGTFEWQAQSRFEVGGKLGAETAAETV